MAVMPKEQLNPVVGNAVALALPVISCNDNKRAKLSNAFDADSMPSGFLSVFFEMAALFELTAISPETCLEFTCFIKICLFL